MTLRNHLYLLAFLFPLFFEGREIPLFLPPKGWEAAQPKHLSQYVEIGFITKGENSSHHPSINLAKEDVDVSLKEYVKAVKEIHLEEPGTSWRDLGEFSMKGGKGRLTEVTTTSPWGPLTLLQAILVKNKIAYVLTSAALKTEFPKHRKEILNSFKSLTIVSDPFAPIQDIGKKKALEACFKALGNFTNDQELAKKQDLQWSELQAKVQDLGDELGAYWQFLVLKEGYAKIYKPEQP